MSHHRYLRFVLIATIVMAAGCEETQTLTFGTGETDTSTVTCTLANEPYGTACECDAQCASNKCSDDNKCICNNSSDCNGDTPYCSEGVCVSCDTICSTGLDIAHECVCDNECNTHPESPECINDIPEPQVDCLNINSIVAYFNNSPKINALVKAANQENATESEKRYSSIQEACGNLDNIKVYTGTDNNVFEFSGAKDKACIIICGELTTPIIPSFDIQKTKHIYGFPPSKKNESSSLTADEDFKNNAIIHFTPITATQLSLSLSVTDNEHLTIDNISLYYSLPVVPTQTKVEFSDAIINEINNTTIHNIHLTLPELTRKISLPENSDEPNDYGLFANTATNSSFSHIQIDTPNINITVNKPSNAKQYVDFNSLGGFIGKTTDVEIKELKYNTNLKIQLDDLDSTYIKDNTIKSHIAQNIGGIVGIVSTDKQPKLVQISNIIYNGDILLEGVRFNVDKLGGIVGYLDMTSVTSKTLVNLNNLQFMGNIHIQSTAQPLSSAIQTQPTDPHPPEPSPVPDINLDDKTFCGPAENKSYCLNKVGGIIGNIQPPKSNVVSLNNLKFNNEANRPKNFIKIEGIQGSTAINHYISGVGGLIGYIVNSEDNYRSLIINTPSVYNLNISIPKPNSEPNTDKHHQHQNIGGMIGASVNVSIIKPTVEHLSIDASQTAHVGGLMGHAEGEIYIDNRADTSVKPQENYTTTGLNAARANIQIDSIEAKSDVGGIIGHIKSSLSENESHKLFISNINVSNGKIIATNSHAGGIVGYLDQTRLTMSNINHAAYLVQANSEAGGFIGSANNTTPIDLYNLSNAILKIQAQSRVGGIAGYLQNALVINAHNIQNIVKNINGEDNSSSASFIGRLYNYNNINRSHQSIYTNLNSYATSEQQSDVFINDGATQKYIYIYTPDSPPSTPLTNTINGLNNYPPKSNYNITWGYADIPVGENAKVSIPCFTDFKIYNDKNDSDPITCHFEPPAETTSNSSTP